MSPVSPTRPISVAILIATYRRPEGLQRLLASLAALTFENRPKPDITIVVVDNDAAAISNPPPSLHPVHYVVEPQRGLSAVRNRALDEVPPGTDFVAFIDDDEWAEPQWLDALLAMQAQTAADIVQGPVVPAFELDPPDWMRRGGYFEVGPFQPGEKLTFGATGNCLIRCAMLQRTGLRFDMRFNTSGGEDADFFERHLNAGGEIIAAPAARAHELVPAARMSTRGLMRQQFRKGNTIGQLDAASGLAARYGVRTVKAVRWMLAGGARAIALGPFVKGAAPVGLASAARGFGMLAALVNVRSSYYGTPSRRHTVTLVSDAQRLCGIEAFSRRLSERLMTLEPDLHAMVPLPKSWADFQALRAQLRQCNTLLVSLPIVAWKRRLVAPLLAIVAARSAGSRVQLIVHEWDDLDWKRRWVLRSYVPWATSLLFSSPLVRDQFVTDVASRLAASRRGLVPIPQNIKRPTVLPTTAISAQLAAARSAGRFVVGHFGSIYPKKQSVFILDVAAELKRRGIPVLAVFIGDFVGGGADARPMFQARIAELSLGDEVMITGFIDTDDDVFAALDGADVFAYLFAEGLTSRRGSVLACLASGRPVVVNAPADASEFAHHPAYRTVLAEGRLVLTAHDATPAVMADALIAVRARNADAGSPDVPADAFATSWDDAAAVVLQLTRD